MHIGQLRLIYVIDDSECLHSPNQSSGRRTSPSGLMIMIQRLVYGLHLSIFIGLLAVALYNIA